jgi:hypothetical protein
MSLSMKLFLSLILVLMMGCTATKPKPDQSIANAEENPILGVWYFYMGSNGYVELSLNEDHTFDVAVVPCSKGMKESKPSGVWSLSGEEFVLSWPDGSIKAPRLIAALCKGKIMDNIEIFAQAVWKYIPDEEDSSWVRKISELESSKEPLGDFGPIVEDMLSKGVAPETIARFAKIVGYETAFGICYHLGETNEGLVGVHEVLLSMDPTGREMRPKSA